MYSQGKGSDLDAPSLLARCDQAPDDCASSFLGISIRTEKRGGKAIDGERLARPLLAHALEHSRLR